MERTTPPVTGGNFTDHLSELRRQVEQESAHGRALVADIGDNPVGTVRLDSDIPCGAATRPICRSAMSTR
ncbi:MAG TPA: hypothetical protein VL966_03465 [Alphaproteobacteria bacterium]|jgi:hypothetical protein|nr:hypothetical protein [Alphaproteobacteria bacterium]